MLIVGSMHEAGVEKACMEQPEKNECSLRNK
jgi:hypothetical protein